MRSCTEPNRLRAAWIPRVTLVAAIFFGALACGPIGPLSGGELRGELAEIPDDWGFTSEVEAVQLETRLEDPYSVNVWIYGSGDRLYIPSSLILGDSDPTERQWVRNVLEDDRVRLRVDKRLYELRALRVTDGVELEKARLRLLEKYEVETDDDEGHAEAAWIFRLEPRSPHPLPR